MADTALLRRRPNGTIMPGSALNPTGRPRIVQEIQELARTAAPAAFEKIVALIGSPDERIALAASTEILNRAYGKPVMSVQSDVRKFDMSSLFALVAKEITEQRGTVKAETLPIIDVEAEPVSLADEEQQKPPQDDKEPVEW